MLDLIKPISSEELMSKAHRLAKDYVTNYVVKHRNLSQQYNEINELTQYFYTSMSDVLITDPRYKDRPKLSLNCLEAVQADREECARLIRHAIKLMVDVCTNDGRTCEASWISSAGMVILQEIEWRNHANVFENLAQEMLKQETELKNSARTGKTKTK